MTGSVDAQVRYLNPEWKGRTEIPSIGDRQSRRQNTSKFPVTIQDGRNRHFGLDTAGFLLTEHRSKVTDFHHSPSVEATYYAEIEAIIEHLTGADRVVVFQHVVRTEDRSDFNKAYARFVHCDYSVKDPRERSRAIFEAHGGLDPSIPWQFAWYNTWQPIEREVQQSPLAMIDTRSLAPGDLVDYYYSGFGDRLLSSMPVYNPEHEFFYFPRMQTNEMLVIKQLDSRADRATSCPHTSFDLEAPEGALGRRSIEVRLVCAFAPRSGAEQ